MSTPIPTLDTLTAEARTQFEREHAERVRACEEALAIAFAAEIRHQLTRIDVKSIQNIRVELTSWEHFKEVERCFPRKQGSMDYFKSIVEGTLAKMKITHSGLLHVGWGSRMSYDATIATIEVEFRFANPLYESAPLK